MMKPTIHLQPGNRHFQAVCGERTIDGANPTLKGVNCPKCIVSPRATRLRALAEAVKDEPTPTKPKGETMPNTRVLRVSVANISPAEYAQAAQSAGVAGFVHSAVGFGDWGTEPSIVAEHGAPDTSKVLSFVAQLLSTRGEQCAYVTVDGKPSLLYVGDIPGLPDGYRLEPLA